MRIVGAVDIGGTKIAAGAVAEDGTILCRLQCPTATGMGFEAAMQRTREMLHEISLQTGKDYAGIGVACPGPLDPSAGIIGNVGTLPGWQGGNIFESLGPEFGVTVALENDADAGALAEASWGQAGKCDRFIYVTISTGIGAGLVISGELYRGAGGAHPEIGHQLIDGAGPLCYCSARGCWESLASGPAMTIWMRENDPESPELSAHQICDLARGGHAVAMHAVERESRYIGLGLANLITIFAPDTIALAGGVMRSADLLLDGARRVIAGMVTQVSPERTRIMPASLGPDTGLAGAAMGWLHRYGFRAGREPATQYAELFRSGV
jgi:glucokinase